jgi:hypothetical protein
MKHYHGISFGFALCIIAGMTLDAWAHVHGATDNTFFTLACNFVYRLIWQRRMAWRPHLPPGRTTYRPSSLGVEHGDCRRLIWAAICYGIVGLDLSKIYKHN